MVFLDPFWPPFYELGNFVKILDPPPPFLKNFPSEILELCEFFLTPPPFGNFSQKYHVPVLKASLRKKRS